jgi:hypothetical protein
MARPWASSDRRSAILLALSAALALCALAAAGCQGRRDVLGKVSGKVSFQGQPLTEGLVVFANEEKGVHITAPIGPGGVYTVRMAQGEGLPLGTYQVAIAPPVVDLPVGMVKPPAAPRQYSEIPAKYRQAATSELTLNVQPGANTLDVDMQH